MKLSRVFSFIFIAVIVSACSVSIVAPLGLDSAALTQSEPDLRGATAKFENYQGAALVVGQSTFNDTVNGSDLNQMGQMWGPVSIYQNRLYAGDADGNGRILVFDPVPSASTQRNDIFAKAALKMDRTLDANILDFRTVYSIEITPDGKMLVADTDNHRLLVWNQVPSIASATALNPVVLTLPDLVIGQADLINSPTICDSNLFWFRQAKMIGNKLVVVDYDGNRTLIWNALPTATSRDCSKDATSGIIYCSVNSADIVMGTADCSSSAPDLNGHLSLHQFQGPREVWSDGTRFMITDTDNHRVLVWNSFPSISDISNYDATVYAKKVFTKDADYVLGDPDGASGTDYNRLSYPYGMTSNGTQLFLAESGNCRVLIWNQIPIQADVKPDVVLGIPPLPDGTPDFNTNGCSFPVSARTLSDGAGNSGIQSVYYKDHQLWVSGYQANRLLMFQGADDTLQCGQKKGYQFTLESAPGGSGSVVSSVAPSSSSKLVYPTLRDSSGVFVSNPVSNWSISDSNLVDLQQNFYDLSSFIATKNNGRYSLRSTLVGATCLSQSLDVVFGDKQLLLRFDEGTGATSFTDSSSNAFTATCSSTPCPSAGVAGQFGSALSFAPTDHFLRVAPDTNLQVENGEFSVSFWFKANSLNNNAVVANVPTDGAGFFLVLNRFNTPGIDLAKSWIIDQTVSYTFDLNRWYHVVAVQYQAGGTPSYVRFFVNGDYVGSFVERSAYISSGGNDLVIGGGTNPSDAAPFDGKLDDLSIWSRALTLPEIKGMYQARVP